MDNELKYGLNIPDPVTMDDVALRVEQEEQAAVAGIYANATKVEIDPLSVAEDVDLRIPINTPPANIAAGSTSSGFSGETFDVVESDNTAGTRVFLTQAT